MTKQEKLYGLKLKGLNKDKYSGIYYSAYKGLIKAQNKFNYEQNTKNSKVYKYALDKTKEVVSNDVLLKRLKNMIYHYGNKKGFVYDTRGFPKIVQIELYKVYNNGLFLEAFEDFYSKYKITMENNLGYVVFTNENDEYVIEKVITEDGRKIFKQQ